MRSIKNYIKEIVSILLISIISLLCIEGFSSILVILLDNSSSVPHEVHYTKYDELLGWANIPNIEIMDVYGPGIYLKNNSQSFRNNKDFSISIPKEKIRIICSGDSFTHGDGVDNEHTWCQQLTSIDNHLETINVGQSGYGIDQAYLWYMRDGKKFEHNIQIFAFVIDDFYRMENSRYNGLYSKPILKLINNELEVKNIPVSIYPYLFPKLTQLVNCFDDFRFYGLFNTIRNKICLSKHDMDFKENIELQKVTLKVFDNLDKANKEKNSNLVLVLLPEHESLFNYDSDSLRKLLSKEMAKRKIVFIDMFDEFENLPSYELKSLFLTNDPHYSEKGNKFVANILYKNLYSLHILK